MHLLKVRVDSSEIELESFVPMRGQRPLDYTSLVLLIEECSLQHRITVTIRILASQPASRPDANDQQWVDVRLLASEFTHFLLFALSFLLIPEEMEKNDGRMKNDKHCIFCWRNIGEILCGFGREAGSQFGDCGPAGNLEEAIERRTSLSPEESVVKLGIKELSRSISREIVTAHNMSRSRRKERD